VPTQGTETSHYRGKVVRWIFITEHPIKGTGNCKSAQIILPAFFTGRLSNVYISVLSATHTVAPKGKFVAVISAFAETANPQQELEFARKLIGNAIEEFFYVTDFYEPTDDGREDQVFVTTSYDPTPFCETLGQEVSDVIGHVLGEPLNLVRLVEPEELRMNEY